MSTPPEPSLWHNRDFNVYWLGQGLSGFGDAFASLAIPLLVLQSTGSLERMGRLSSVVSCAYLASGVVSGSLVDRVDRRKMMVRLDLARWAITSAVPLVWWLHGPSYPLLVAIAALAALLGNTFQVASITAVANLVPRSQLLEANGRLHGSYAVMFFVGPMLAGWVCDRFGPATALAVDCVSYLASAASLTLVRARFSAAAQRPSGHPLGDFVAGVRFLWEIPTLRAVTVLLGLSSLLLAGRDNLVIYHLKHELHQGDRAVGNVFATAALGAVAGAALAPRMRARWGFAACWLGAGMALGVGMVGVGRMHAAALVGGFAAVIAFGEAVRGINTMTLRQEVTPDHMLGRVTASFWTLLTAPAALGAELFAGVAERHGVTRVLGALGITLVALMCVGAFTPIRRPVASRR